MKVVILGDYGVGKTTFVKRSVTGHLARRFNKNDGCDILPMMFSTNKSAFSVEVQYDNRQNLPRRSLATVLNRNLTSPDFPAGMGYFRARSRR